MRIRLACVREIIGDDLAFSWFNVDLDPGNCLSVQRAASSTRIRYSTGGRNYVTSATRRRHRRTTTRRQYHHPRTVIHHHRQHRHLRPRRRTARRETPYGRITRERLDSNGLGSLLALYLRLCWSRLFLGAIYSGNNLLGEHDSRQVGSGTKERELLGSQKVDKRDDVREHVVE